MHRDRRPDLTVSGAPSPCLFFRFEKFLFVPVSLFLSVPRHGSRRSLYPAIAHCKTAWEFGGIAASPLAASPHAHRSREISLGGLPSSGLPLPQEFAGDHATGTPLTQCPPARLLLNAHRPASDSMPAGSPLTQARRIAADSCPPDHR